MTTKKLIIVSSIVIISSILLMSYFYLNDSNDKIEQSNDKLKIPEYSQDKIKENLKQSNELPIKIQQKTIKSKMKGQLIDKANEEKIFEKESNEEEIHPHSVDSTNIRSEENLVESEEEIVNAVNEEELQDICPIGSEVCLADEDPSYFDHNIDMSPEFSGEYGISLVEDNHFAFYLPISTEAKTNPSEDTFYPINTSLDPILFNKELSNDESPGIFKRTMSFIWRHKFKIIIIGATVIGGGYLIYKTYKTYLTILNWLPRTGDPLSSPTMITLNIQTSISSEYDAVDYAKKIVDYFGLRWKNNWQDWNYVRIYGTGFIYNQTTDKFISTGQILPVGESDENRFIWDLFNPGRYRGIYIHSTYFKLNGHNDYGFFRQLYPSIEYDFILRNVNRFIFQPLLRHTPFAWFNHVPIKILKFCNHAQLFWNDPSLEIKVIGSELIYKQAKVT